MCGEQTLTLILTLTLTFLFSPYRPNESLSYKDKDIVFGLASGDGPFQVDFSETSQGLP